jgi:glycosyltransferase involved in cell wall biosynthesis
LKPKNAKHQTLKVSSNISRQTSHSSIPETSNVERPPNCPPVTVLICTLNEENNLPLVLPKIPHWVDEVLLVDGHSKDNTLVIAKQICPRIKILIQPGKGKGDALKFGVQQASGKIIVTLDADGSTNPEDIPRFILPLLEGFDFAKGSRFLENRPKMRLHRRFGNWVLTTTSNFLHGTKYTDICSGYNAFKRQAFQNLKLTYNGFAMEQEMNVKIKQAGFKVIEVSCIDNGRRDGDSKVGPIKQGLLDWLVIIRERFRG